MKLVTRWSLVGPRIARRAIIAGMILAAYAFSAPFAAAQSTDPNKILKGMSDYIVGQKSFSLTYDSAVEVITPELQKLQFTSSGEVDLNRPDKLRSKRTGGFSNVETVFDGKTFTVINKDNRTFAQLDAVGTVDQLIQLLRDKYAVSTPGSDLLFSNPFDVLTENAIDAKFRSRRHRRCQVRAPGVSRCRYRLADLDRSGRAADSAPICHHQQGSRRRPPIHGSHQGMESGRSERRLYVQTTGRHNESCLGSSRPRRRNSPGSSCDGRQEMTRTSRTLIHSAIAMMIAGAALIWNGSITLSPQQSLISSAAAYTRPPVSATWTGAAARSVRRHAVVGAAVGTAAATAAATSGCVQAVDAYGRIYTRC